MIDRLFNVLWLLCVGWGVMVISIENSDLIGFVLMIAPHFLIVGMASYVFCGRLA